MSLFLRSIDQVDSEALSHCLNSALSGLSAMNRLQVVEAVRTAMTLIVIDEKQREFVKMIDDIEAGDISCSDRLELKARLNKIDSVLAANDEKLSSIIETINLFKGDSLESSERLSGELSSLDDRLAVITTAVNELPGELTTRVATPVIGHVSTTLDAAVSSIRNTNAESSNTIINKMSDHFIDANAKVSSAVERAYSDNVKVITETINQVKRTATELGSAALDNIDASVAYQKLLLDTNQAVDRLSELSVFFKDYVHTVERYLAVITDCVSIQQLQQAIVEESKRLVSSIWSLRDEWATDRCKLYENMERIATVANREFIATTINDSVANALSLASVVQEGIKMLPKKESF